jgi:hypothetical protein
VLSRFGCSGGVHRSLCSDAACFTVAVHPHASGDCVHPEARQVRQADMCGGRDESAMFPEAGHPLAPGLLLVPEVSKQSRTQCGDQSARGLWIRLLVEFHPPIPIHNGRPGYGVLSQDGPHLLFIRRPAVWSYGIAEILSRSSVPQIYTTIEGPSLNPQAVGLFSLQFAKRTRKSYAARAETFWS